MVPHSPSLNICQLESSAAAFSACSVESAKKRGAEDGIVLENGDHSAAREALVVVSVDQRRHVRQRAAHPDAALLLLALVRAAVVHKAGVGREFEIGVEPALCEGVQLGLVQLVTPGPHEDSQLVGRQANAHEL
eukprot:6822278-Prymnesium_polylepis.1